eukprot:scaffold1954_cov268-Pinguiococcus_pyrenoidosus.AAC.165
MKQRLQSGPQASVPSFENRGESAVVALSSLCSPSAGGIQQETFRGEASGVHPSAGGGTF